MPEFTIARRRFELDPDAVRETVAVLLPDPIQEHYVVVSGRRFPPKQIISCLTGLDRADFTTHQARRVLLRLGFVAARVASAQEQPEVADGRGGPYGGRQAAALEPFTGKWVALSSPTEVLVAADSPREVLSWLSRHGQRADYGMFKVPAPTAEAEGTAPL